MKGIVIDLKDMSDSREVLESKEAPGIRWFIYILLTALIAAIIFACVFEVDECVRVQGEIKSADAESSVLATASCCIKEINVTEGQSVKSGDVLYVLDADYAIDRKAALTAQLDGYTSDLDNTMLLKQSIESNVNLLDNTPECSKYYYRYEQYQNGVQLSEQEFERNQQSSNLTLEEKQRNLSDTKNAISSKRAQLREYRALADCIQSDCAYGGGDAQVMTQYNDYAAAREKALQASQQYKSAYDAAVNQLNTQDNNLVSAYQVESAKAAQDAVQQAMTVLQSSFLTDLRSKILVCENQIAAAQAGVGSADVQTVSQQLAEYTKLQTAVEQNAAFSTPLADVQAMYNQYAANFQNLAADYQNKTAEYETLCGKYEAQAKNITSADVDMSKTSYESALSDVSTVKNNYTAQINSTISQLETEIQSLDSSRAGLEASINGTEDLTEYEKLSGDKMRNEAIISINSEIDSLNQTVASVKAQIAELDETIKNSEIKAAVDGVVTLVNEMNVGDIVSSGSSLCTILPTTEDLKVMLYIPENEVSKLTVGQSTEYAFDAIPYHEYGKVKGEIQSISADSIGDEKSGAKYYLAQADLSAVSLENDKGETRDVKVGMLVEGKIITQSKKAMIWFLQKLNLWN